MNKDIKILQTAAGRGLRRIVLVRGGENTDLSGAGK
jgi:hypothetical protein